jgi:hypothetical protein
VDVCAGKVYSKALLLVMLLLLRVCGCLAKCTAGQVLCRSGHLLDTACTKEAINPFISYVRVACGLYVMLHIMFHGCCELQSSPLDPPKNNGA